MGEGRKKPNFQADRGNGKISGLPSGLIFCLFLSENCNKEYWIWRNMTDKEDKIVSPGLYSEIHNCALLDDLRDLIIDAKQSAYSVVNATQTLLYWKIGKRINNDILSKRTCRIWPAGNLWTLSSSECWIWQGFFDGEFKENDTIFRGISGWRNCRITDATIELDSFYSVNSDKKWYSAGFLFSDVPYWKLVCPHTQKKNWFYALWKNCNIIKAWWTD